MESRTQIARLLANAEARIERLRGELATAEKEAELFRQILQLQTEADGSNIDSNMQTESAAKGRRARISAGRATIKSASRDAAGKAGLSDLMIADLLGASRQAVQKWHTGKLAIPRRHADKLEKRGIPAESWPKRAD